MIKFNVIGNLHGSTTNLALVGITDNVNANLTSDFLSWIGLTGATGEATELTIGGSKINSMVNGLPIEIEIKKNGSVVSIFYKGTAWGGAIIYGQRNFTVSNTNNIYFGAVFPNRSFSTSEIVVNLIEIYKF